MKRTLALIALLACLAFPSVARADEPKPRPLVVEHYDILLVIHQLDAEETYTCISHRVYFVRGTRIIADRYLCETMRLNVEDGLFVLWWSDHDCHRRIMAPCVIEADMIRNIEDESNETPWWAPARRMTSLAEPPCEE